MMIPPSAPEHWEALRNCWLDLQSPQLQQYEETEFSRDLHRRHADVLAALTTAGELETRTADRIRIAFTEAVLHIQRDAVTCYRMVPPVYGPRQDVIAQAAALAEMAQRSDIDPEMTVRIQDSMARNIAWLVQFEAGQQPWRQETVEASPAEVEAAHILTDLLSGNR